MVRTPVKKPEREVPDDIVQFIEDELYDAELEEERNPQDQQLKREVGFLTSLWTQLEEKKRPFTSRQEAMVRRMMRRNKQAPTPSIGSRERRVKVEVFGVKADYQESKFGAGGKRLVVTFFTFDIVNREIVFKLWEGTKAFKVLRLDIWEADGTVDIRDYPDYMKISGTVSWSVPGRFGLKKVNILESAANHLK